MPASRKRRTKSGRTRRTARQAQYDVLRTQVAALLDWKSAHVGFEAAVADVPAEFRGRRVPGAPHSLWELLEHLRLSQRDILDYCVNPDYQEGKWPDDYWPTSPEPPTAEAWDQSIAEFRRDLSSLKRLAQNPKIDLTAPLPHAPQHTYLRELLLAADHNAYHIGQIVQLRRLLGIWQA